MELKYVNIVFVLRFGVGYNLTRRELHHLFFVLFASLIIVGMIEKRSTSKYRSEYILRSTYISGLTANMQHHRDQYIRTRCESGGKIPGWLECKAVVNWSRGY